MSKKRRDPPPPPPPPPPHETPKAVPIVVPEGGAVVRMYCTGLGDCFLSGLRDQNGETGHILIDCGVWKGTPKAKDWMIRIMSDIKATVGARGLDLLAVTHPHWDHLSGFGQAREVFESIPVKEVWLPWTEDDAEPDARRLAAECRLALQASMAATVNLRGIAREAGLRAAEPTLDKKTWEDEEKKALHAARDIEAILKFSGFTPVDELGLSEDGLGIAPGTGDLLGIVKARAPGGKPRYLRPSSSPVVCPTFPGVNVYSLGPPTDLTLLGKDNPSKKAGKSEVYAALKAFGNVSLNEDTGLIVAMIGSTKSDDDDLALSCDLSFPFDPGCRIPTTQATLHPEFGSFFRSRYHGPDPEGEDLAWRRIDMDWLEAAGQLAFRLDSHINNTSLVLAFELGTADDAPVLIFPGDAQVGNWLSWHTLDDEGRLARGLLERTVLYKVGHHASHNATLKAKGLDLMTRTSRLVAMLPVDECEAKKPKGSNPEGWDMPYGKLLAQLVERTRGRVLRSDTGVELLQNAEKPEGWSDADWKQFREDTDVVTATVTLGEKEITRPFYIQYTVRQ